MPRTARSLRRSLRIVPAAAKQGNVELAELISAAVNDALVNYGAAMANALADRNPQLAGLQQQLAAVGARARAGMDAVLLLYTEDEPEE